MAGGKWRWKKSTACPRARARCAGDLYSSPSRAQALSDGELEHKLGDNSPCALRSFRKPYAPPRVAAVACIKLFRHLLPEARRGTILPAHVQHVCNLSLFFLLSKRRAAASSLFPSPSVLEFSAVQFGSFFSLSSLRIRRLLCSAVLCCCVGVPFHFTPQIANRAGAWRARVLDKQRRRDRGAGQPCHPRRGAAQTTAPKNVVSLIFCCYSTPFYTFSGRRWHHLHCRRQRDRGNQSNNNRGEGQSVCAVRLDERR